MPYKLVAFAGEQGKTCTNRDTCLPTSHCYMSQRQASLYWGDPLVCIVFTNNVGLQGDRERQAGLSVSPLMDRTLQGGMTRSQVCLTAPTTVVYCSSSLLRTQGQNNQACIHIMHCCISVSFLLQVQAKTKTQVCIVFTACFIPHDFPHRVHAALPSSMLLLLSVCCDKVVHHTECTMSCTLSV